MVGQTFHGIGLGVEVCLLANCDDVRPWVVSLVLGAGAGMGLSLGLTGDGITSGHATLLNSATLWGFWNGLGLLLASNPDNFRTGAYLTLILSQGAGIGVAELIWHYFEPRNGDVSMVNSAGVWTMAVTALAFATGGGGNSRVLIGTMLALSDLAILGTAFATQYYPMSRGRTLLIDVGGVLGLLLGMGSAALIAGDGISGGAFWGSALTGTVAGLGLMTFFTRNWDLPDIETQVALLPVEGGAMVGVGGRF